MNAYQGENVINGNFGEVWVESEYIANATGIEAKMTLSTTKVSLCKSLKSGTKIIGVEGKGTIKLHKVDSYFIKKMAPLLKAGKTFKATIITKLDDPDAFGDERVKLIGCVFTELTLADWEHGKLGEESVPFEFSDFEVMDSI